MQTCDPCSVDAYTVIRQGCPMDFHVSDDGEVEIRFGAGRQTLMTLLFDMAAFRAFLDQGAEALRSLDKIHEPQRASLPA